MGLPINLLLHFNCPHVNALLSTFLGCLSHLASSLLPTISRPLVTTSLILDLLTSYASSILPNFAVKCQNGLEIVPHRCLEQVVYQGSTRSARLHRQSPFARHQSLCLAAADYRMRRPVIWEELCVGSNFWRIFSHQKQLVHPISDRISPSQDLAHRRECLDCAASLSQ
jgi:hypothetical protein